jgi:hypothetical protein
MEGFQSGQGRKWSSFETSGHACKFNTAFLSSLAAGSPHKGIAMSLNYIWSDCYVYFWCNYEVMTWRQIVEF